uniref:U3 small nucleolar RNA-associated protein 6 homolog n=3 Tax=Cacopsylla melanoneura TaxID=428564 RepID=A0A8D8LQH2_9HEMI
MATESVQACIEASAELSVAIAETKLLNEKENRLLIIQRKHFEKGIKMVTDQAEEQYIRYISYDWDMIEMIQERRKSAQVRMEDKHQKKTNEVILMFGNNINHLFLDLLKRFPNNLKNWALYLEFCRKMKMHNASFDLVDRMIKVHGDKPIVFAFAAEWTLMRRNNYELARTYLLQGLHSHRDSHDLYLELLKNELEFTSMLKQKYAACANTPERDSTKDDLLAGANCKLVYDDAKNNLKFSEKTIPLFKSMIQMMNKYEFARQFTLDIISDILKEMPKCEWLHDLSAKSHLINKLDTSIHSTPYPLAELEKCYETYRTVLDTKCDTELMWSLALDFLNESIGTSSEDKMKMCYLNMANEAHENKKLSVNQYMKWMKILDLDGLCQQLSSIQSHVLENERLSTSPEIWQHVLKFMISAKNHSDAKIYDLFERGCIALKDKGLPLFLDVIAHFMPHKKDLVNNVYQIGINMSECPTLCSTLRVKYLEHLVLSQDCEGARKFYNEYNVRKPFSRDLHRTMYKVEWSSGKITESNRKFMDQIVLLACIQFGENNVDVWIDRIRHDLELYRGVNKSSIVEEAKIYLKHSRELLFELNAKLHKVTQEMMKISEDKDTFSCSVFNVTSVDAPSSFPPSQPAPHPRGVGRAMGAPGGTGAPSHHSLQSDSLNSVLGPHSVAQSAYYSEALGPGGRSQMGGPYLSAHSSIRTAEDADHL